MKKLILLLLFVMMVFAFGCQSVETYSQSVIEKSYSILDSKDVPVAPDLTPAGKYIYETVYVYDKGLDKYEIRMNKQDTLFLEINSDESRYFTFNDDDIEVNEDFPEDVTFSPKNTGVYYLRCTFNCGQLDMAKELRVVVSRGLAVSLIHQVLVEESVLGWEELELEVKEFESVVKKDDHKIILEFL